MQKLPAEARRRAKRLKAEITLGADPQAERNAKTAVPCFEKVFLEKYMPEATICNRGWRKKLQMYELRLKRVFGHKRINEIKRAEIRSWHVSLREDGLSPAYSDRFLALLRHVLNFCVQTELLDKNPAAGVKSFSPDNRVEHYLSQDELKHLLTALNTWKNRTVALILLLAAATGMRIGEILKLKWAEVDLEHKLLTVSASTSKSKKLRSVPLNETAMDVLSKLDTRGQYESVFINKRTKRPYTTISKQWDIIRKVAGFPQLRIHDLRHQFASLLINEGVSLYTVKALLGHAQIATTERYSHLTIDSMLSASCRVSDIINGAMPKATSDPEPATVNRDG
jgi:site-specific recombinase XerD